MTTHISIIVEQCKTGDNKSQFQLYKLLAPKLLMMGMRYLKSKQEAEDCLQETFVKLFKNINSFKGEASFETWATKIMINSALTKLKSSQYARSMSDLAEAEHLESQNDGDPHEYSDLLAMLRALPNNQRLVFNMFVIEGFSHKEIAEILKMEESTSRSHLLRAKEALKNRHQILNNQKK